MVLALGCGDGRPAAKAPAARPREVAALAAGDTPVLFAENFESGYAQGWTGLAGTWAVRQDSGNFVYTNTANVTVAGGGANVNDNWAVYGSATWTDYAVEARVKPLSFPGTAGIVRIFARWQNPSNWYYETLTASPTADTSVTLAFTEVSDGTGYPASYDVRYAASPIAWGAASAVTRGTCATPLAGRSIGARLTCTVFGLVASTPYGFQVAA